MSTRRRRVDWDEELRKTENIRRRGLFISGLSFGVAALFIFGAGRLHGTGVEISRKIIWTFIFLIMMFLTRGLFRRRERLRQERQEREYLAQYQRRHENLCEERDVYDGKP